MSPRDQDRGHRHPQRGVRPDTTETVQTRDQAGAQADPGGGVRGRAEGGVSEGQGQPQESGEASHQEVVLCSISGVRTSVNRMNCTSFPEAMIKKSPCTSAVWFESRTSEQSQLVYCSSMIL